MTLRKLNLRKCHDTSCLTMCLHTPAHFGNNPEWLILIGLFSFHSAVQRSQTIKPNWLDGRFSAQVKLRHNGGFWKTTTSVCRKPTHQRNKRLQEKACHNIMTTIPVFQRQKGSADTTLLEHLSTCWMQRANSTVPTGFNFKTWMHTARWCAAIVPVQLLQIMPSGKPFLPSPMSHTY